MRELVIRAAKQDPWTPADHAKLLAECGAALTEKIYNKAANIMAGKNRKHELFEEYTRILNDRKEVKAAPVPVNIIKRGRGYLIFHYAKRGYYVRWASKVIEGPYETLREAYDHVDASLEGSLI